MEKFAVAHKYRLTHAIVSLNVARFFLYQALCLTLIRFVAPSPSAINVTIE